MFRLPENKFASLRRNANLLPWPVEEAVDPKLAVPGVESLNIGGSLVG